MGGPFQTFDPFGEGFPPLDPPVFPPIGVIPPIGGITPIGGIEPIAPIDATPVRAIAPNEKAIAYPWFPKPDNQSDDMAFRGAVRQAQDVMPLIDGVVAFNDMEIAVASAKHSVLLAFWDFNPETSLIEDSSKTWFDLLKAAAARGVEVRLLMSDFDPMIGLKNHVRVWKRYSSMLKNTRSLRVGAFQVVCARHEAETKPDVVKGLKPMINDELVAFINGKTEAERKDIDHNAPGLWGRLDFDASNSKVKQKIPGTFYPVYPASHHTKLLVVDGQYAYVGGMNVAPSYLDLTSHDLLVDQPWHDAFVRVEGSQILRDFLRCFVGLWNQERARSEKFLTDAFAVRGLAPGLMATSDLDLNKLIAKPATGASPKISSQIHRTVTRKSDSTFGIGAPDVVRQDILEGYLLAIGRAENFIYVENQYFREKAMIDAIIRRAKEVPDLRVIFLVPKVAEELKTKADTTPLDMHGAALQFELLQSLKTALKDRLGLYAMVRNDGKDVYVHSKLFIIDDAFASIGSANTNPRGFRMDSELDFTWYNKQITEQLRFDLWQEILGSPSTLKSWKPRDFVTRWDAIARSNARKVKNGFVVFFENLEQGKKMSWFFDVMT